MSDMKKVNQLVSLLPEYILVCLRSPEYAALFGDFVERFGLTSEQKDVLEDIVLDLFLRSVAPSGVLKKAQELFRFDTKKTQELARDIVGEFIAPFPKYFLDGADVLRALGGKVDDYLERSKLFIALLRYTNEKMEEQAKQVDAVDIPRERLYLKHMIEKNLTEYFYLPDDPSKVALNNLAVYLLMNVENYHTELLHALYENKQPLGEHRIEREGNTFDPSVAQWVKDFIGYSSGDPSTIQIARYLTQNKNARSLDARDRAVLQKILEMYRVLKLFPASFSNIAPDRWIVIPYKTEESSAKEKLLEKRIVNHSPRPPAEPPLAQSPRMDAPPPPPSAFRASAVSPRQRIQNTSTAGVRTMLPPELSIPELSAPSASLHSLAPVAVQTQTVVLEKPQVEEIQYEFFLDQAPKTVISERQKKTSFSGKNYTELADEVLVMSGVFVSDGALHTRLQNIIITRLKNIRTAIEIRERLGEPAEKGGFGLSAKAADSIVRNANIVTDLLLQGVLRIRDTQEKQAPVETDIREIKELVKREFSEEQKKFGRSRLGSHEAIHHAAPIPVPVAFDLPFFSKSAPLADIPISSKKPVAPPPPQKSVAFPRLSQIVELAPLSVKPPEEKKEIIRVSPPSLQSRIKIEVPPVKIKERFVAVPQKLDALSFRKALKSIPAIFSKKLSIQQIAKGTDGEVTHKQPHSFFGATDMPHVQHAGLPAFSIEEVDGVPMIVQKQKEKPSQEDILRAEALRKEIQKKEEEEKAKRLAQEQKIREETEKKKKAEEEQRIQEEKEKAKRAAEEAEKAKNIAKAKEVEIEALKREIQRKEEEQKARREEEKAKARAEEVKKTPKPEEPKKEEIVKKQIAQEPVVSVEAKREDAPSTGAMPQSQPANGGSLFSNIFHIPVSVKTTPQQPGKVSFSDIKTSPRLIDTIEELRIFTLKDFRRLSEDPMNSASRIYDKIQGLEKDSFTKKIAAISAWRESEVNILYVQIGQEALLKGKSITSVIDQLKAEGKEYLTEQEFDAVLELNERIRM